MDASRSINRSKQRGSVLIWVCLAVVVIVSFAALSVDIGYLYSSKSELQNAADAAALAGVAKLDGTSSTTQTAARNEAYNFALNNKAAGDAVTLDKNTSNAVDGDIVVGYWDASNRIFYPNTTAAIPFGKTLNAVQIIPKRTNATNNPVGTFFAKIFNALNVDIKAKAVAAMVLKGPPLLLCALAPNAPAGTKFELNGPGGIVGTAWTLFLPSANVNTNELMGQAVNYEDHCSLPCIGTTNGTNQPILQLVNDAYNSSKNSSGTWEAVVPIVDGHCILSDGTCPPPPATSCTDSALPNGCPPGSPTGELDHIAGWAKAYITSINLTGKKGFTAQIGPLVSCASNPLITLGTATLVK